MSNVMPEFTIDSMSANILLRVNPDMTIDAKVVRPSAVTQLTPTGTVRISGNLYTVQSVDFVRIYPS